MKQKSSNNHANQPNKYRMPTKYDLTKCYGLKHQKWDKDRTHK